jgi:hypothetical protein
VVEDFLMNKQEDPIEGGDLHRAMRALVDLVHEKEYEAMVEKDQYFKGRGDAFYERGRTIMKYNLALREYIKRHAPQEVAALLDSYRRDG